MDTENAATIASARNCNDQMRQPADPPRDTTSTSTDLAERLVQIESARRHLTLAALRWQARLDAHSAEVS